MVLDDELNMKTLKDDVRISDTKKIAPPREPYSPLPEYTIHRAELESMESFDMKMLLPIANKEPPTTMPFVDGGVSSVTDTTS